MRPRRLSRAFSMIEILFVIAVISLMIALTMPSLRKAKEYAEFVRWATMSHSIQVDPDLTFYLDFQNQLATSAELWNKAAGPALGARDIEDAQFAMAAAPSATTLDGVGSLLPDLFIGALVDPADLNGVFGNPNSTYPITGDDHPKWGRGRWEKKAALEFDNRKLVYGTKHPQLDPRDGDFTISCWFKMGEGAYTYGGVLFSRLDGPTKQGFYMGVEGEKGSFKPILHVGQRDGYQVYAYIPTFDNTVDVGDGQWHQVVWVRSDNILRCWVDGKVARSKHAFNEDLSATNAVWVLGNADVYGSGAFYQGFGGAIDEFAMYRRALSEKEITDAYLAGKPQYGQDDE